MAVDTGNPPIGVNSKNLGNVVGLYRGINPPVEADGVTEKRYIFWAKQYPTNPVSYKIHEFDPIVNAWVPVGGVSQDAFNLLRQQVFGTLDDIDLQKLYGVSSLLQLCLNSKVAMIDLR